MVQIAISFVVALLLVAPGIAAPFAIGPMEEIDSRELAKLATRRIHVHLPKVHINKQFVKGLEKYGPTIGKQAFKMAKMFLREDIGEGYSLVARDANPIDQLHELLARSPRRSIGKLMKAAKQARKFVKAHHKELGNFATEAMGMFGRSLEDHNVDARELDFHLEILERALDDWVAIDERDLHTDAFGRDLEDSVVFGRDYDELEELD